MQPPLAPIAVRMDKWLWAARIFKTRSLASESCRKGRVTISGQPVKASRDVHVNDVIVVRSDQITRTFKVLGLLERRVGAQVARDFVEDQTPPSEYEKRRQPSFQPLVLRPKGAGRPTKKQRRQIDSFIKPAKNYGLHGSSGLPAHCCPQPNRGEIGQ